MSFLGTVTDKENLYNFLRLVMIVTTYLLFRPYLEQLFRKMSGAPNARQEQLRARVAAASERYENQRKTS
jgi:Protein trafficking PGA2